jgi:hypothetical protein
VRFFGCGYAAPCHSWLLLQFLDELFMEICCPSFPGTAGRDGSKLSDKSVRVVIKERIERQEIAYDDK